MGSNGQVISMIQRIGKTVEARLHLDSLIPEQKVHLSLPKEANPLFTVSYKEINLKGIEKLYQLAREVLPLKNFLVGKQKGQSKNKCALSLYAVINKNNKVTYCLDVESIFVNKLELALLSPVLSAKMWISGLDPEHVEHLKMIVFCLNTMANFKLTSGTNAITKQFLENAARAPEEQNRTVTFHLTVDVECQGAYTSTFSLAPGIAPDMFLSKLYDLPKSSKDVTIVAANKKIIRVHKIILMAHSPTFLSMFSPTIGMAEAKSGRILMEENSAEGLTMFVRCLYGFRVPVETISPDLAVELFQLSHKYFVAELEKGMKNFLTRKDAEWHTVDSLLEMYFFVKNLSSFEDLAHHALIEMSKLAKQSLMSSDYFKKLKLEDQRDLVVELWDWSK